MNKSIEEITADLIKIKSTASQPGKKQQAIEYIKAYFASFQEVTFEEFPGDSPAIIVKCEERECYDIIYCMHLDVVDGNDEQFQPYIKDGRIYGRGAADMKGPTAVVIKMYGELLKENKAGHIALLFTTDEETGSSEGAKAILSNIKSKCAIVPDNKCLPYDHIVNESKGILFISISVKGIAAHGSRPWDGQNAIELLIEDITAIRKLFNNSKNQWKPTLNIGKISGGDSVNKVPDFAQCLLDIRTTQQENNEYIYEKIQRAVKYATIEILFQDKPFYTSNNNIYLKELKSIMHKMLNTDIPINREEGGSDARFFSAKQIPAFLCKPLSYGAHETTEWVDIKSMYTYLDIFKKFTKSDTF